MTRVMEPPDNLVDQMHYDVCHGRIPGPEIHLTAQQMEMAPTLFGRKLHDGVMFLGKVIRLTDGIPDVVYPPKTPNKDWVVGGINFRPRS